MPWPTGGIPTTNLDAGTDSPGLARPALLATVQAVNDIAGSRGAADGVASLDSGGKLPAAQLPTVLPAGMLAPFAGAAAPSGWLLCDGSAVSRATFAALFAAVGTAFGAGDGSTTFNLPDARGRALAGRDDMGGTAAGRLTSGGSGVAGATLGAAGGAQTHTLSTAEMPAHTHNTGATIGGRNTSTGGGETIVYAGSTYTSTSTGGGSAHNNVQPTLVVNYIIKT